MAITLPNLVLAAGTGLSKIDKFLNKVSTALSGGGGLVLTICLMIAGYKIWNGARTMQEMGPLLIGGILIGSASLISGMLMD